MTPNLLEEDESPQVYLNYVIQALEQGTLVLLQSSSRSVEVYQTDSNCSASCSLLPVEWSVHCPPPRLGSPCALPPCAQSGRVYMASRVVQFILIKTGSSELITQYIDQ